VLLVLLLEHRLVERPVAALHLVQRVAVRLPHALQLLLQLQLLHALHPLH
jgi:hypothetical protein